MKPGAGIEGRTLRIDGLDLHVMTGGAGDAVLLLHGFPDAAEVWRVMLPGLVAAGFRVIAPDQRGFGRTTMPPRTSDYTIARIAADAIALLDALGIAQAALIGHDWGAVIGWRLVADHPDRFSRFVALSVGHPNALTAAGLPQMIRSWYVLLFQLRGVAEIVFRAFDFALLRRITDDDAEIVVWRRDLSRPGRLTAGMNWYRANFTALLGRRFPSARVPVLGLIGSADVALTVAQMSGSAPFVDAAFRCIVIDGAGHWLPLHAAAEVTRHAVAFLTDGERRNELAAARN